MLRLNQIRNSLKHIRKVDLGSRSIIRLAREYDAESVLEIYRPICESSPASFEIQSPTVAEIQDRIRKVSAVFPWLIVERLGNILGYAYASRHRERAAYRWSVDVTVYVHQGARQNSVGTALYTVLLELLRIQGFLRAYAGITLPNPASIRLHEKLGFRPVGIYHRVGYKLGDWHDVQWMEVPLSSENANPAEPTTISQIDLKYWEDAVSKGQRLLSQ
jgi:L-amino acid N-acyltransferase YncA